ncbi:uncharacterized protein LOC126688067 isoform X2 [Mercurialis annua]|uniref:uncharacterized protein LOC126688067 isoform X2 n=1 Tax=Mercurialis annua TaxID=3986 RepID=UPI00215F7079|nr:uncharacterized protein LOC126688067 isoform X2 [Mercurialis annua]
MSGGFFRGTSADQDTRFSNKHAKLLKSQKFAAELEHLVDTRKVKMDVIRPWIASRVTELLGFEDEVLINFIYGLLEAKEVNGKEIQIQLTGFMEKNTVRFMRELWSHLLSAQKNESGVPQKFLDDKEEETRKKQAEMDRITNEIQKKKEKESKELELERSKKMDGGAETKANVADMELDSKNLLKGSRGDSDDGKAMNNRNGIRGRVRGSPRNRRSSSNSRSHSGHRSRSLSRSPKARRRSISSEGDYGSPRKRSISPRRRYISRGSRSPARRISLYSRQISRSPLRRRSPSPVRHRLRSPYRRRSPSPFRRRSPSPVRRRRSPSPLRRRRSPPTTRRRRSPSPLRRRRSPSPFRRRRSPSPLEHRSPSPVRRRSPLPVRRKSLSPTSPVRRRSPSLASPVQRRSPSPASPVRRRSPSPASPVRRRSSPPLRRRSPPRRSPPRRSPPRRSPSPLCRRYPRSPSTPLHRSPSPRHRSSYPTRMRSPVPSSRRPPSPHGSSSPSPVHHKSPSPGRKYMKERRSPVQSLEERPSMREKVLRRPSSSLRSPKRDARDKKDLHDKLSSLSPSPEGSNVQSEFPPRARVRNSSEDKSPYESPLKQQRGRRNRSVSPYESPLKQQRGRRNRSSDSSRSPMRQRRGQIAHDNSLNHGQKLREQKLTRETPESGQEDEETEHARDYKSRSLQKQSVHSSTLDKQKDSHVRPHSKDNNTSERVRGRETTESRSHIDNVELRTGDEKPKSEKSSGKGAFSGIIEGHKSPVSLLEKQEISRGGEGQRSGEKNRSHPNNVKDDRSYRPETKHAMMVEKLDQGNGGGAFDSGSEENGKRRADNKERGKHKRSHREEVTSDGDYSCDSEIEDKKEAKRRKKGDKKLRKEEKRRRREERRRRKEERRAEKLKLKDHREEDSSEDDHAGRRDSHPSDEDTLTEQKKLEIELRKKAIESLKAKKGINH